MIAEALQLLIDLSHAGQAAQAIAGGPRLNRYVIGGEVVELPVPAPPRNHKVGSLAEIIALANRFKATESPAVWYNEERVVLVIDDQGHRVDRTSFDLHYSDTFAVAIELRKEGPWLELRDFIRLIRLKLADTLPPSVLLDKVRKLKFENGQATTVQVQRNQESLGRELVSRVEAVVEIPEEVALELPVYRDMGEAEDYVLRCTVETDPQQGRLQLRPKPDEIDRVRHIAMQSIEARLTEGLEDGIPAYYGSPGA